MVCFQPSELPSQEPVILLALVLLSDQPHEQPVWLQVQEEQPDQLVLPLALATQAIAVMQFRVSRILDELLYKLSVEVVLT